MSCVNEKDIENILNILDEFSKSEISRMNIQVNDNNQSPETIDRTYHHGRCDVGSPWAAGKSFDVIEEEY